MELMEALVVGSGPTGRSLPGSRSRVSMWWRHRLSERRVQVRAARPAASTVEVLDLRGPLDDAHQRVIVTGADRYFARLPVPFADDGGPARRSCQDPAFVAAARPGPIASTRFGWCRRPRSREGNGRSRRPDGHVRWTVPAKRDPKAALTSWPGAPVWHGVARPAAGREFPEVFRV
ncbi:hypothetical protein [Streptomyces sp. NPDC003015]